MSSPRLQIVPPEPASGRRPMSHPLPLDRGRTALAARRVSVAPVVTPHAARGFWAGLVARRCGTREEAAVVFGVTFQTACNWFDGFSTPTGDKVLMAVRLWPEEFGLGDGCDDLAEAA
jgi:hypothetical protein